MHLPLAWMPGPMEWVFIAGIALLIFGKRLPEVGRSLGKGIVEFKKGLRDIEDEIDTAASQPPRQSGQKSNDSSPTPPTA